MEELYLVHSAKGSSWKKHKYIKIVDGRYYYVTKDVAQVLDEVNKREKEALKNAEDITPVIQEERELAELYSQRSKANQSKANAIKSNHKNANWVPDGIEGARYSSALNKATKYDERSQYYSAKASSDTAKKNVYTSSATKYANAKKSIEVQYGIKWINNFIDKITRR